MKIKFRNVCYSYKLPQTIQVLSDINLEIISGEFIGIVGPTGSGKTTLLQHFTGLLKPTSGTVCIDDKNIWSKDFDLRELRKRTGLVFQFPESQLFEDTVFADVAFAPHCQKLSNDEVIHRVKNALKLVGMEFERIGNRSPYHLSVGEMRRVALAGVLAMAPEMLILDEPTAGLDSSGVELITKILKRLTNEGIGIILISHNMDLIFQLSSRIMILNKGNIIYDGDKKSIFNSRQLFRQAKLELPRIIQFAQYLHDRNIIKNWEIYSKTELETQLTKLFKHD